MDLEQLYAITSQDRNWNSSRRLEPPDLSINPLDFQKIFTSGLSISKGFVSRKDWLFYSEIGVPDRDRTELSYS